MYFKSYNEFINEAMSVNPEGELVPDKSIIEKITEYLTKYNLSSPQSYIDKNGDIYIYIRPLEISNPLVDKISMDLTNEFNITNFELHFKSRGLCILQIKLPK